LKSQHTVNLQIDDINNSNIIEDVHIPSEVTSNIFDELVKTSTLILDDINISEDDIHDLEHVLVGTKHETVDTSVITSSKSFKLSRADCGYVVTFLF